MSKRTTDDFGNELIFVAPTEDETCDLCGVTAECRPYGPKGENICHPCGMKNEEETGKMLGIVLFGDKA